MVQIFEVMMQVMGVMVQVSCFAEMGMESIYISTASQNPLYNQYFDSCMLLMVILKALLEVDLRHLRQIIKIMFYFVNFRP